MSIPFIELPSSQIVALYNEPSSFLLDIGKKQREVEEEKGKCQERTRAMEMERALSPVEPHHLLAVLFQQAQDQLQVLIRP